MEAGQLDQALTAARQWRAKDAYNLVVIRLVADILGEMGKKDDARRTYSSVVELLPHDAEAQRALATVEKQAGDLAGAYERLEAASEISSTDARMKFELADLAARTDHGAEARTLFQQIVASAEAADAVRYPAKQRLAQILVGGPPRGPRRGGRGRGRAPGRGDRRTRHPRWDDQRRANLPELGHRPSDVDLWVTTPGGEKVFYQHKVGKNGEALFDDVTTGYGPESFTAKDAQPGEYLVQVNYYGSRRSQFPEARGEVTVVLHEGSDREQQVVLPYRLFASARPSPWGGSPPDETPRSSVHSLRGVRSAFRDSAGVSARLRAADTSSSRRRSRRRCAGRRPAQTSRAPTVRTRIPSGSNRFEVDARVEGDFVGRRGRPRLRQQGRGAHRGHLPVSTARDALLLGLSMEIDRMMRASSSTREGPEGLRTDRRSDMRHPALLAGPGQRLQAAGLPGRPRRAQAHRDPLRRAAAVGGFASDPIEPAPGQVIGHARVVLDGKTLLDEGRLGAERRREPLSSLPRVVEQTRGLDRFVAVDASPDWSKVPEPKTVGAQRVLVVVDTSRSMLEECSSSSGPCAR